MVSYEDYVLNEIQMNYVRETSVKFKIRKYIEEHGEYPEGISFEATDEEIEEYRKIFYSLYYIKCNKIPFRSIRKVCDYLYEAECNDVDYDFAFDYFKVNPQGVGGACSSMRSGNYFGRNFDWYYNHDVDFVIHTPRINGRYASIGVAGCQPNLTASMVDGRVMSEYFKIMPFMLLDGINEHGVFVNDNVVPGNDLECTTTGTTPLQEKKGDLCMNMLPRFVLDNYRTAREAIDDIRNHWSVYMKPTALLGHYEVHYMIGDPNETYIVEFFNNEMYVEKTDTDGGKLSIMTNFYIKGVELVEGRIGNVGENLSGLTTYGSGVDRYNILADRYEDAALSKDKMIEAMESVWYSQAYDVSNKWYSEMVGSHDYILDPDGSDPTALVGMNTDPSHYEPIFSIIDGWYEARNRDEAKVWHTTHTSVYDIENRRLYMEFQEKEIEDETYVFDIKPPFGSWGNEDGKDY